MIYLLLRNLIRLALRVYFRKVHVLNKEVTYADQPIILAANHANGIMDVIVLAGLVAKSNYYFLVPQEIMNGSWKTILLKWLHCIPAELINDKLSIHTLGKCSEILRNNGKLIVFVEDKPHQSKRLANINNDASTTAFEVEEPYGFSLGTVIIPTAINYTYFNNFRSELMLSLAPPLFIADYKDQAKTSNFQALFSLNDDIRKSLIKEMVIIEQEEHEIVTERLLTINRNDCDIPSLPWKSKQQDKLRFDQIIVEFINKMATLELVTLRGLTQKTSDYFGQMTSFGINDRNVSSNFYFGFSKYLMLMFLFPVFCIGYITNILPIWLTGVTSPSNVEDNVWHEANRFLKGIGLWLINYSLLTTLTYSFVGLDPALIIGGIIPVFGYFTLYYMEWGKILLGSIRFWMAKSSKADFIKLLRQQREEIIQQMIKKPERQPVANIKITDDLHSN